MWELEGLKTGSPLNLHGGASSHARPAPPKLEPADAPDPRGRARPAARRCADRHADLHQRHLYLRQRGGARQRVCHRRGLCVRPLRQPDCRRAGAGAGGGRGRRWRGGLWLGHGRAARRAAGRRHAARQHQPERARRAGRARSVWRDDQPAGDLLRGAGDPGRLLRYVRSGGGRRGDRGDQAKRHSGRADLEPAAEGRRCGGAGAARQGCRRAPGGG